MTEYRLADLLDLTILQNMADAHYQGAGMPTGIIDAYDGSILVGAGWQDICVNYHRVHPAALERCHESDRCIRSRLVQGEAFAYKCKNGLWDIGMPIVVAGEHVASMFLGQFFYDDEQPDRDFFKRQAREFGFDEDAYLAALDRVPVFSREKVDYILQYNKALSTFIAELAERALHEKVDKQEARRQAEFLQTLIDAAPNPIFYKGIDRRYLGCNRAFEELFGVTTGQVIGKTVYDIESQEQADRHTAADTEILSHPGTRVYENPVHAADGTVHDIITHKATFNGPDGAPAGIIGVLVDISERKLAERENRSLQEQLAQSQRMESVGRLAGGVAHDFNNMLNIILGYSELMMLELQPADPLYSQVREVHVAGERSRDITRQLLAFARKEIIAPKVLDLNASIDDTLKILQRLAGESISLTWLPGQGLWPVLLDPSQLDQILANLCINARDAIADVGKVVIATGTSTFDADSCPFNSEVAPGDYVWFSVSDNGCGMDRWTLDNIFEPFFTTKEFGQGSGMGLATVYGIIKQNGGDVRVQSVEGEGSTFTVYLPKHEAASPEAAEQAAEGLPMGEGETVLVVDDEVAILQLTEQILATYNYAVITAKSPTEALRWADASPNKIDLLVTDVIMPEMNGRDLAERLAGIYPGLKCLFMSGYAANVVTDRGLLDEGLQFIQKPWATRDFVAKVKSVLTETARVAK